MNWFLLIFLLVLSHSSLCHSSDDLTLLKNKRILHISTHPGLGMGDHVCKINIFKILREFGYDSRIFLVDDQEEQARFVKQGIPFYSCTLPYKINRGEELYKAIDDICRRDNIDIIHAHHLDGRYPEEIFAAVSVAKRLPVAVVITHHSGWLDKSLPLDGVDGVMSVHFEIVKRLNEINRSQHKNIKIIEWVPPFVDQNRFAEFKPLYTRKEFFKKIAKVDVQSRPVVACVANFYPVKNHITLLHAIRALIYDFKKPVHLMLAGDGCKKHDCKALVQRLKLQKYVHFLGYTNQIPELLYHSDIKVLPSTMEGFSIALMEAAMLKKPLVGTRGTGMTSMIIDGQTGLLFNAKNSDELAHCVLRLIKDPSLAKKLGNGVYEHFYENFTAEACLKKLAHVYVAALSGKARA